MKYGSLELPCGYYNPYKKYAVCVWYPAGAMSDKGGWAYSGSTDDWETALASVEILRANGKRATVKKQWSGVQKRG